MTEPAVEAAEKESAAEGEAVAEAAEERDGGEAGEAPAEDTSDTDAAGPVDEAQKEEERSENKLVFEVTDDEEETTDQDAEAGIEVIISAPKTWPGDYRWYSDWANRSTNETDDDANGYRYRRADYEILLSDEDDWV